MQAHAGHAWEHSGSCSQAAGARVGVGGMCGRVHARAHAPPLTPLYYSPYLRAAEAGVEEDAPRRAQVSAVHLPRCKEGACA